MRAWGSMECCEPPCLAFASPRLVRLVRLVCTLIAAGPPNFQPSGEPPLVRMLGGASVCVPAATIDTQREETETWRPEAVTAWFISSFLHTMTGRMSGWAHCLLPLARGPFGIIFPPLHRKEILACLTTLARHGVVRHMKKSMVATANREPNHETPCNNGNVERRIVKLFMFTGWAENAFSDTHQALRNLEMCVCKKETVRF